MNIFCQIILAILITETLLISISLVSFSQNKTNIFSIGHEHIVPFPVHLCFHPWKLQQNSVFQMFAVDSCHHICINLIWLVSIQLHKTCKFEPFYTFILSFFLNEISAACAVPLLFVYRKNLDLCLSYFVQGCEAFCKVFSMMGNEVSCTTYARRSSSWRSCSHFLTQ